MNELYTKTAYCNHHAKGNVVEIGVFFILIFSNSRIVVKIIDTADGDPASFSGMQNYDIAAILWDTVIIYDYEKGGIEKILGKQVSKNFTEDESEPDVTGLHFCMRGVNDELKKECLNIRSSEFCESWCIISL